MMRQAGRYQKVYQDLCKKHTTFRERSENTDLAVEISLQPWRAFKPDGVILFSDILTPLPAMNIKFDLPPGKGPLIETPIRTMEQVREVTTGDDFTYRETNHYVGEALQRLREEVKGTDTAVLGFAGCPFTLATYIVEGGSSKNFTNIKAMMYNDPKTLHALLEKLTLNVIDYVRYQADMGAEVVQIFDSWAAHIMPQDFDVFCGPYNKVTLLLCWLSSPSHLSFSAGHCPSLIGPPPAHARTQGQALSVGEHRRLDTRPTPDFPVDPHEACLLLSNSCPSSLSAFPCTRRRGSSKRSRRRTPTCPSSSTSPALAVSWSAWPASTRTSSLSTSRWTSATPSAAEARSSRTRATWTRASCSPIT